ncbi:MAG TPA: DNA-formamidopyrimidine glycosylase family protein [Anaerolineae bacterium]|nr:DNA-formamidopyrimidine glycosylase family protein [Anaerolineae bacterium]HQI86805.1 DNA-formamidopyrimidine glycosylase family protein [Anaerolineae bacterium]
MPEYPDIVVYIERLRYFIQGQMLKHARIAHIFLLRTADPPIAALEGRTLQGIERIGKRIVFDFNDEYFLVLHLMISGRLHWYPPEHKVPAKGWLAALDFANGTLLITENSTQKRASLHLIRGQDALRAFDRGGLEVMDATFEAFRAALKAENHTLKRALTDQRLFSGIGNAYSDEILHRARLSPFLLTKSLTDEQVTQLAKATRVVLAEWVERLRSEAGDGMPKVTAFHEAMAVHGRYDQPCPVCGVKVQRIRYAENETNYCPRCQTEDRLLADRALSRLLKDDWPRTIEELEERRK